MPISSLFEQIETAARAQFPGEPIEIDFPPTDWGTGQEEYSVLVGPKRARCYQARVLGAEGIGFVRTG